MPEADACGGLGPGGSLQGHRGAGEPSACVTGAEAPGPAMWVAATSLLAPLPRTLAGCGLREPSGLMEQLDPQCSVEF